MESLGLMATWAGFSDFQHRNARVAKRRLHQRTMQAKCSQAFFSRKDRESLERAAEVRDQNCAEIDQIHAANKTGRNKPCPCGSGDKYKFCCGVNP